MRKLILALPRPPMSCATPGGASTDLLTSYPKPLRSALSSRIPADLRHCRNDSVGVLFPGCLAQPVVDAAASAICTCRSSNLTVETVSARLPAQSALRGDHRC